MRLLDFFRRKRRKNEIAEDVAPGWAAIDGSLRPIYGDQKPQHWGTLIKWMLGGPDPLDGVSAYHNDDHWHYVTYGFSELYAKESENAEVSGFGFELTFRLRSSEATAPIWPVHMLQNIARYIFKSGNPLDHGHYMDANGPLEANTSSALTALIFLRDPQLPPIATPHGQLTFLEVVGITRDEYNMCRAWNPESFAEVLGRHNPLFITDVTRASILDNPDVRREVEERQSRDGSSSDGQYADSLSWTTDGHNATITITARVAETLPLYLRGRLRHDRPFSLYGAEQHVALTRGATTTIERDDNVLQVTLSDDDIASLEQIPPRRGEYRVGDLTIAVIPALLRNADGEVVHEIG